MNQLAREVCETPIEVGELERRIRGIQNTKELEPWKMMLLYGANAAVFSVFFGSGPAGTVWCADWNGAVSFAWCDRACFTE